MIPLFAIGSAQMPARAAEMGCAEYGQLLNPRSRNANWGGTYAIDNFAFSGFDPSAFRSLLRRERRNRERCLFVAVPDVVGSARRTLEVFEYWSPRLSGWPLALVAQDGQEDLPIPWHRIRAVFIGGTDRFKESQGAAQIIAAAKAQEKWVHVGRVNTVRKWRLFEGWGADSIDGTGLCMPAFVDERLKIKAYIERRPEQHLFTSEEESNVSSLERVSV